MPQAKSSEERLTTIVRSNRSPMISFTGFM